MTKKYGFNLDSQSGYDNRYIKTNLKTYDKTNCVFTDNEIPKENSLFLHCSNLFWFCTNIKWRKLSSSIFRTM